MFAFTEEYSIQGYYVHGWEEVTVETSCKEALDRLREYWENEPGTAFRLRSRAVPVPRIPVYLFFATARHDCLHTVKSWRIGSRALVNSRWRAIRDGAVDMGAGNGTCQVREVEA